jgi:uncharacterized repeat protein (TIGR03803 family)
MKKIGFIERACFVSVFCLAAIASPAQTFTTMHSFNGTDGSAANSGLVRGTDGNFYGTTVVGGANQTCGNNSSCGTVFQITPGGTLTTLHSFNGTDGALPEAGLVQGSDGKFYGTTSSGGTNSAGTIFSIIPGGTPVTLHSFCSQTNCADGSAPSAPLVQGSDGNFYGTTSGNPIYNFTCSGNCGTVFKITPAGTLTTLYTFDGTGGYAPLAALVQGSDGNFYGTTSLGGAGAASCPTAINTETCGTVFKITPQGTLTTLYNFCTQSNCSDGNGPSALVQGSDGSFYGTTAYGGALFVSRRLTTSIPVARSSKSRQGAH